MIELWETEKSKHKRNLQFCERFWKLLEKKWNNIIEYSRRKAFLITYFYEYFDLMFLLKNILMMPEDYLILCLLFEEGLIFKFAQ